MAKRSTLADVRKGSTGQSASESTALRLSPAFRSAINSLVEVHNTGTIADYIRGLVYLDVMLASGMTDLLDKPAWVTRDYGSLIRRETSRGRHARHNSRFTEEFREQLHEALDALLEQPASPKAERLLKLLKSEGKGGK